MRLVKMEKYSKEVHEFLVGIILPKLEMGEYTKENIGGIVDYIFREIEGPLCDAEEAGDILNDSDKELLLLATKAITEITTRSDWEK